MPKVSVVLPTYNRLGTLERALASVLEQSYTDFEVIVVDDCSTDATRAYIEGLSDVRVRYFRHDVNRGASAARNTGIKVARGCYIGFQDSDDVWLPDKLRDQLECLERNLSLDIVFTSFVKRHPARELVIPPESVASADIAIRLALGNFIGTPTVVARRSVLLKGGGFDTSLCNHEDWDLWLTLASGGAQFYHLSEVLLVSPHSPGGVSDAQAVQLAEAFEHIYLKHQALFETAKAAASMNYLIGKLYSLGKPGNQLRGRTFLRRASARAPFNPKYALFFLLSLVNHDLPRRVSRLRGEK